jgi:hypothetical protein
MATPGSAAAASAGTQADAQRVSPENVSAQDAGAQDASAAASGSATAAGPDAGSTRDASRGGAPAWIFGSPGDTGGPGEPGSADVVTIGEEEGRGSGSWVTRPRAAAISALAIFVIVAGIMVAAKIADSPASHPASHPSPAAVSTPSPAVSGTAPLVTQRTGKHTRKHAPGQNPSTSLPPGTGILPTTRPVTKPPSGHTSSPTKPKPSPTPTKTKKPTPTPTPTTPTPTPTPTTPTPTPGP